MLRNKCRRCGKIVKQTNWSNNCVFAIIGKCLNISKSILIECSRMGSFTLSWFLLPSFLFEFTFSFGIGNAWFDRQNFLLKAKTTFAWTFLYYFQDVKQIKGWKDIENSFHFIQIGRVSFVKNRVVGWFCCVVVFR